MGARRVAGSMRLGRRDLLVRLVPTVLLVPRAFKVRLVPTVLRGLLVPTQPCRVPRVRLACPGLMALMAQAFNC